MIGLWSFVQRYLYEVVVQGRSRHVYEYGPEDFGCERKHLNPNAMGPKTPYVGCPNCGQPLHPDEVN